MKSQEKIYVFLYSSVLKRFDTELILSKENLSKLELRARINTHKDLNLYCVSLTPAQALRFNQSLNFTNLILDTKTHNNLFDNLNKIQLGF